MSDKRLIVVQMHDDVHLAQHEQTLLQAMAEEGEVRTLFFRYDQLPNVATITLHDRVMIGGSVQFLVSHKEPESSFAHLVTFVRQLVHNGIPFFGMNYGAYLLAHAYGGDVQYRPQSQELGIITVRRLAPSYGDATCDGLPQEFSVPTLHQEDIITLPLVAIPLCNSDGSQYQLFKLAGKLVFGTQFYPQRFRHALSSYVSCAQSIWKNVTTKQWQRAQAEQHTTLLASDILTRFLQ